MLMAPRAEIPLLSKKSPRVSTVKSLCTREFAVWHAKETDMAASPMIRKYYLCFAVQKLHVIFFITLYQGRHYILSRFYANFMAILWRCSPVVPMRIWIAGVDFVDNYIHVCVPSHEDGYLGPQR